MRHPNLSEADQLAILAELASPLVHESNNFLNNLFLHMTLFQEHLPDQLRADCESVRREGKKLVDLLRQWQGNRRGSVDKEVGEVELNQMIAAIVEDDLCSEDGSPRFQLSLAHEPLWLHGTVGKYKRFCQMWLQNALELKESLAGTSDAPLVIRTEKTRNGIRLQITCAGSPSFPDSWPDFDDQNSPAETLTLAACRSLARHLHGNVRMERGSHGQCKLIVEFS